MIQIAAAQPAAASAIGRYEAKSRARLLSAHDGLADSLDTSINVLPQLIHPESDHLPTKPSELVIAPKIIDLPKAIGIAMVPIAVDFDIDPASTGFKPRQVEPPTGDRKLGDALDPTSFQGVKQP